MLSLEQQYAYNLYLEGKNLFITGSAGTGKSHILKQIVEHARGENKEIAVTAMTGRAAVLLGGGASTFHSWAGIGLGQGSEYDLYSKVCRNKKAVNWESVELLIVDEVSMMSQQLFDLLVRLAPRLRSGGFFSEHFQVIFSADFFQLPPIGTPDKGAGHCFESEMWDVVFPPEQQIEFTTNYRQQDDLFREFLNRVRVGKILQKDTDLLYSLTKKDPPTDLQPCRLYPLRYQVEQVNARELKKLNSPSIVFKCESFGASKRGIERILKSCQIEEELILKVGAQVMCTRNLDVECGICNGALGKVSGFLKGVPVVDFINGRRMEIKSYEYKMEDDSKARVVQLPLMLAWACTIHKSQGATLDLVCVNAGRGVFERGQLYVALSRAKTLEGLFLEDFDPQALKVDDRVTEYYRKFI